MAKPTLLIIDDERPLLKSLSTILEEDFHVIATSNGRKILSIIEANPVSLILLDLQMPGINGVELLEKMRNAGKSTPVLIMTGNSCQEWAEKCADLNVQGYIKKPIDIEKLKARIDKVLGIEDFDVLREIWKEDFESRMASISPHIKNALNYVCRNYHRNITREEVAAHSEISHGYLSRQFHRQCGINFREYMNAYRIYKSEEHLMDRKRCLKEVAAAIGINDLSHYCKLFKKIKGLTPAEYREKNFS